MITRITNNIITMSQASVIDKFTLNSLYIIHNWKKRELSNISKVLSGSIIAADKTPHQMNLK